MGQGPQGQEIDLHHAGIVHALLVPLADVTTRDGGRLHRHEIGEGGGAQQHSARVLRHALGKALQAVGKGEKTVPTRPLHQFPVARQMGQLRYGVGIQPTGQSGHLVRGQPQGLAQAPHHSARLVRGEHSGQHGMVPTPFLDDAQYETLTYVPGKVQVDVRHRRALGRQKTVQGQAVVQRINVGQADQVPDQH